jgi:polysaccharide deacetylase 2 family uncharacterized protein YibQ
LAVLAALAVWGIYRLAAYPEKSSPRTTADFLKPSPNIPFEETTSSYNHGDKLQAIDEALFAGLREGGVGPEAAKLSLRPGPGGEVTLIRVKLPSAKVLNAVNSALSRRLRETDGDVIWLNSKHGSEINIRLQGRLTHQVSLILHPRGRPQQPSPPPKAPTKPGRAKSRHRVAIVIDDIGYRLGPAKRLLALDLPLTLSILPHSPHGREIALLAAKKGLEILVHLPMEPKSYPHTKPGPGALLTNMPPQKLYDLTLKNLDSIPGATGANNHMGSRFTEDPQALAPVLRALASRGVFFLDSLTSPHSQAFLVAKSMGLKAGQRHIFLDHNPTPRAVRRQMKRLLALSRRRDGLIAIGHPHDATIKVLVEFAGHLRREVKMVRAAALVKGTVASAKAKP